MSHDTHTEHAAHHGPKNPAKAYAFTLITLLCLTFITVGAASIDFGSGNVVIALGIATIKASLVALIFMNLRYDKPVNAVIALSGFLFLGIMLTFCLLDIDSRRDEKEPARVNMIPVAPKPGEAAAHGGEAPKPAEAPKH